MEFPAIAVLAKLAPIGEQPDVRRILLSDIPEHKAALIENVLMRLIHMPSHEIAAVYVSSPLGKIYQSHLVVKGTGERRERGYWYVSETIERREVPAAAAGRGILEELGLDIEPERIKFVRQEAEVKESQSEGRLKKYLKHCFALELTEEESKAAQLVADEEDALVYFEWRQC
jgi:hypothetical protein